MTGGEGEGPDPDAPAGDAPASAPSSEPAATDASEGPEAPEAPPPRPPERFPDGAFALFGPWDRPGFRAASLVLAVDGEQRALMQMRDDLPGIAHGGHWAPFGGMAERGESVAAAAIREFREETGLTLREAALRPFGRALAPGPTRTRLYVFVTRLAVRPNAVRLGEGAGFAFLSAAMLRRARTVPAVAPMIGRLADALEAGAGP